MMSFLLNYSLKRLLHRPDQVLFLLNRHQLITMAYNRMIRIKLTISLQKTRNHTVMLATKPLRDRLVRLRLSPQHLLTTPTRMKEALNMIKLIAQKKIHSDTSRSKSSPWVALMKKQVISQTLTANRLTNQWCHNLLQRTRQWKLQGLRMLILKYSFHGTLERTRLIVVKQRWTRTKNKLLIMRKCSNLLNRLK